MIGEREVGRMDRLIEIQYPSRQKNTFGDDVVTWKSLARVWASANPMEARERFASQELRAAKVYTFLVWYLSTVTPDMRILFNGESYRITGLAEIGRRERLQITAEFLEARGDGG